MKGIHWLVVCSLIVAFAACGPAPRPGLGDTPCNDGELKCDGKVSHLCVEGQFQEQETCALECADSLGCVVCQPGTGTCNGNESHACRQDGSGYEDYTCDPVQGSTCDGGTGVCTGPCAPQSLGTSYIGCEYYPTVTGNTAGNMFDFAVAVSNTTSQVATIQVEAGALGSPMTFTVPPSSVVVQTLPWVQALKLCNTPQTDGCIGGNMQPAALAAKGAYHLRSNQPVTVYQFNALQYQKAGQFSYSNDASLMLPTNVWRSEYYAAAWQHLLGVNPSQLAVTAWKDGTMVTIDARADTLGGNGAPAFVARAPQTVMLNAGDVIEITTKTGDLTGSHITSTSPVQVVSGHYCANIPDGVAACDHLEESMFSVDALGRRYMIHAPAMASLPNGKAQTVRVIATAPGTNLIYDPPQAAPTTIANAGDFVEIPNTAASFMVSADQKILVAQYMSGQDAGGGAGDPDMALAVPVEQFRLSYMFHAPTNYNENHVDVTAPMGATVLLDGAPLTGFNAIGTTGFGLVRATLTAGPNGDGTHSISSDTRFSITVYGYGDYTSYWYAGGLDLTDIVN